MSMVMSIRLVFLVFIAMLGPSVGCSLLGYIDQADPRESQALAKLPFPADVPRGSDVSIELSRSGIYVSLVNFSPCSYSDVYIWLNQQYVTHVSQIDIGANEPLTLKRFINRHGESFPVGAFLVPQKARPIISADLYDPAASKLFPLQVRFADN